MSVSMWVQVQELAWKRDKPFHLAGAFMFGRITLRLLNWVARKRGITVKHPRFIAWCMVTSGGLLLEVYQHLMEPMYDGKMIDSVLDLIVNAIGAWMGVSI